LFIIVRLFIQFIHPHCLKGRASDVTMSCGVYCSPENLNLMILQVTLYS